MKEATAELNMTVVTIVLIGVIAGFFVLFWPSIQESIQNTWNKTSGGESSIDVDYGNLGK